MTELDPVWNTYPPRTDNLLVLQLKFYNPILNCPTPVEAAVAKWLPLHPTGSVAALWSPWGKGIFVPFPQGEPEPLQWDSESFCLLFC